MWVRVWAYGIAAFDEWIWVLCFIGASHAFHGGQMDETVRFAVASVALPEFVIAEQRINVVDDYGIVATRPP